MQSIPGYFLVLSLLILCFISSILFQGFIFSLLEELQTVCFCKNFMKWSCIWSNRGKSSLFDRIFRPGFNYYSRFQKLLESVVCNVSISLISYCGLSSIKQLVSYFHKLLRSIDQWSKKIIRVWSEMYCIKFVC